MKSEIVDNTLYLFEALNCTSPYADDNLECLRDIPAGSLFSRLVALGMLNDFSPFVDGAFVPRHTDHLIESGEVWGVPSMWGTVPFESAIHLLSLGEEIFEIGMSEKQARR